MFHDDSIDILKCFAEIIKNFAAFLYTTGGLFVENITLGIFQLMSFYYYINLFSLFNYS